MKGRFIIAAACRIALCAASFAPLGAIAAEAEAKPAPESGGSRPAAAVIGITAECRDADAIAALAELVAAELRAARTLHDPPARPPRPEPASMQKAAALLESGRKNYFDTRYKDASPQLGEAAEALPKAAVPVQEDARRWAQADEAAALTALTSRALGDEGAYRDTVSRLAATRPSAALGVAFPPGFRKDFEERVEKGIDAPAAPLVVTAKVGTWRVRINGIDRGATPFKASVPVGRHMVGFVHPDDTIGYSPVEVTTQGATVDLDPLQEASRRGAGAAVVCLPPGNEVTKDDGWRILAGGTSPEVVTVSPFKSDLMLTRASVSDKSVKAQIMLPASDAKDRARVAAAVKSLYEPGASAQAGEVGALAVEEKDGVFTSWWFWTITGCAVAAAVGVPVYLFSGDQKGSTLGTVKVKP